jgi:hypothetical protein
LENQKAGDKLRSSFDFSANKMILSKIDLREVAGVQADFMLGDLNERQEADLKMEFHTELNKDQIDNLLNLIRAAIIDRLSLSQKRADVEFELRGSYLCTRISISDLFDVVA